MNADANGGWQPEPELDTTRILPEGSEGAPGGAAGAGERGLFRPGFPQQTPNDPGLGATRAYGAGAAPGTPADRGYGGAPGYPPPPANSGYGAQGDAGYGAANAPAFNPNETRPYESDYNAGGGYPPQPSYPGSTPADYPGDYPGGRPGGPSPSGPGGPGGPGGPSGPGGPGGPSGPPRTKRTRRFSWPKRILAGVVALVVLIAGFGIWLYVHASGEIRHEPVFSDYPGRPAQGGGTNWLLVGTDSREGLTRDQQDALHTGTGAVTGDTARTDSMMLLHSGSNGTSLISLPRDSYVTIPAWTDSKGKAHKASKNKLNAAFAFGGAPLLVKTIETQTGVRIDHFAEVGFGGFVDVTNAVGGVQMCLAKPMVDEESGANLKAGCQTLNGAQALAYVRARYSDPLGDLGRMQRQRAFLAALSHQVSSPGIVLNPFRLVPVLDKSLAVFTTSNGTSLSDLYSLFQDMKSVNGGGGKTMVVPIANPGYNVSGVGSTVLWDATKAQELWTAIQQDKKVPDFPAV